MQKDCIKCILYFWIVVTSKMAASWIMWQELASCALPTKPFRQFQSAQHRLVGTGDPFPGHCGFGNPSLLPPPPYPSLISSDNFYGLYHLSSQPSFPPRWILFLVFASVLLQTGIGMLWFQKLDIHKVWNAQPLRIILTSSFTSFRWISEGTSLFLSTESVFLAYPNYPLHPSLVWICISSVAQEIYAHV